MTRQRPCPRQIDRRWVPGHLVNQSWDALAEATDELEAPERLFTLEPDAVKNLINEAVFALHTLTQHKIQQPHTSREVEMLEV